MSELKFSEYQKEAWKTAMYPGCGSAGNTTNPETLSYPTLKLCGESGEVAEKLGKLLRKNGKINEEFRAAIALELGDVMWYLAALATHLNYDLGHIAQMNLDKLADRDKRGVIAGEGDNR